MSGICGLFNLDQAPVADSDVRAMCSMLKQRGPDGTNRWHDGSIGLAHTLLATTPELQFEKQPFTHAETGCVITADVRLDNRAELLNSLAPERRSETIGDAELILLAYLAWDVACLDRLLGDFAFAIWDPRHRRLFCGRDHFGMRPLFYHHAPGRRFVFASSTRAILVLPQVPYRINEGRVADALVSQLQWIDHTSTFFEEVFRLPPGHKVVVTPAGLQIAEYWRPSPGPDPGPMSDDDYRQGFLELFTRAVESRLRAPTGTVGSMLSGGMDSGSIVAVAKGILNDRGKGPLPTFSAVSGRYDSSTPIDCPESSAIHATMALPMIRPSLIYPGTDEQDADFMLSGYDEPFDTGFMFLKLLYRTASDKGVRVVLDGGAGDVVLGEGSYITRMIRNWQLKRALAEIIAENRLYWGHAWSSSLIRYPAHAILPRPIAKFLRNIRNQKRDSTSLGESIISNDFATRIDLESRLVRMHQTFSRGEEPDYAAETVRAIRPTMTAGRERYARIAASAATEARDPFLDKRLVEFCAHLPGHLRMKNAMYKIILREVMTSRLPPEVAWGHRKPHVGWLFNQAIKKCLFEQGVLSADGLQESLRDYVDPAKFSEAWRSFRTHGYSDEIGGALALSVWLRETQQRPVVPDS